MAERGEHSRREILTQGDSWRDAVAQTRYHSDALLHLLAQYEGQRVLFIGCGSTYYLALYAAPLFQRVTGRLCAALPSSELLLQTEAVVGSGEQPMVVALSRSGETTETIRAAQKMSARGSAVITISCYEETGLAAASNITVDIPAGQEESFAQTRSFAGMLVAVQTLAAHVAGDEALLTGLEALADLAPDLVERADPLAKRLAQREDVKRISYLGSGELYGLASEATVKMKEMSLSIAEPYPFMEFRHGPMALVDQEHLIVGLLSERTRAYEVAVLDDLKAHGATILVVGENLIQLGQRYDDAFDLRSGLPELARGVLYLPLLQLLAYHRAMHRGLNPDRPRNVVMAIRLEGTEMT